MDYQDFWMVFNRTIQWAEGGFCSEETDYTVHTEQDHALARFMAELQDNMHQLGAINLRRSFLIRVAVPQSMLVKQSPRKWISDRLGHLTKEVPSYCRHACSKRLALILGKELKTALEAVQSLLEHSSTVLAENINSQGEENNRLVLASMETAGSFARAKECSSINSTFAEQAIEILQTIGSTAWNGWNEEHKPKQFIDTISNLIEEIPQNSNIEYSQALQSSEQTLQRAQDDNNLHWMESMMASVSEEADKIMLEKDFSPFAFDG